MSPPAILFADANVAWIILFIVFVVFSILSKAVGQLQEVQKEAMRRARANPPRPVKQPGESLEDEIAEFLRRAAERQKPQGERPKPSQTDRPASRPPPLVVIEEATRPFRPPPLRPAPPEEDVVVALPAEPESVAEHVKERFSRTEFGKVGSANLGKAVAQADAKIDERLREKFGRQVGRLAAVPGEAAAAAIMADSSVPADRMAAAPALDAGTIAGLLTNPTTLRQTILVSEILHRPEERWKR